MLSRLFTAEGIKKRSVTAVSRQRFHFSSFISLSEYNIPVSYTHLDVYKRQVYRIHAGICKWQGFGTAHSKLQISLLQAWQQLPFHRSHTAFTDFRPINTAAALFQHSLQHVSVSKADIQNTSLQRQFL